MITNDIKDELSTNFIEYAVAVNTDRSIPDACSGLKPVARRILWDAYDEGYTSNKPHVKSAKVVGSCLARLHPHGDSSVYEAMIRLSQSWVMRYPLIDIHGNNGNISGDGAASSRYTEARLSKIAEDGLLVGLKKKNVEFMPNYSEDEEEPVTLPAVFPNLLCNPNKGLGVACACNWLPHNLRETAQVINDYLDEKKDIILYPDFPTGGLIINKNDIPVIMETGHGSVKVRGKYKIEKQTIIFYEIPYGQTIEGLLNEISEVCDKKEIEGISEVRDESNKKGLRVVIQCNRDADPERIVQQLFIKTNLQTSISYNQVALVDKTPVELNLIDCIKIYINHNLDCLQKEATYDITKAKERLNIVNGLLIALEDIDNIITKIKESESAVVAKKRLMEDYGMNEIQAKAVLNMKLSKLAKLEKVEVQKEHKELLSTIDSLTNFLANRDAQIAELRRRLSDLVEKYGDDRRTEITQIDVKKEEVIKVIPEDVVIMVSQTGYIKRIPKKNFNVVKRGTKGIKTKDDVLLPPISISTIDSLKIFTSSGKMFNLPVDKIPVGTNASKGVNICSLIKIEPDDKVVAVNALYKDSKAKYIVFFTKQGYVKKSLIDEYTTGLKRVTGVAAIKLKPQDSIANVTFMNEEEIILVTKKGKCLRCATDIINPTSRNTMGVKGIKLEEGDELVQGIPIHKETDYLSIFTESGFGKKCTLDNFPYQQRGGKGNLICNNETIVGVEMVDNKDNILVVGQHSSICISAQDIPEMSRVANGNKMLKDKIVSVVKL